MAAVLRQPKGTALLQASKPILKAYVYALVSSTGFEGVRMLGIAVAKRKDMDWVRDKASRIFKDALRLDSFSSLAPAIVGASTLAPVVVVELLAALAQLSSAHSGMVATTHTVTGIEFAAVFVACLAVFRLLNRPADPAISSAEAVVNYTQSVPALDNPAVETPSYLNTPTGPSNSYFPFPAGRTLFLTSFTLVNAVALAANAVATRLRATRDPRAAWLPSKPTATAAGFALSCAVIMWTWVYYPDRLPKEYVRWISQAANMDPRIINSLRGVRSGEPRYGVDTGRESLESFAVELGYPAELGDHTKTCPMPCVLIHSGKGPNCEYNALVRFIETGTFALKIYLPLNLGLLLRKRFSVRTVTNACTSAARSAAFLGAFAGAFHYTTCLTRTKLLPALLGRNKAMHEFIDSTICIPAASLACGWSILLEQPMRREEMALFVAPRALRAMLPTRYAAQYQWREQWAFAFSVASILTAAKKAPELVPGIWGRMLSTIYA